MGKEHRRLGADKKRPVGDYGDSILAYAPIILLASK